VDIMKVDGCVEV